MAILVALAILMPMAYSILQIVTPGANNHLFIIQEDSPFTYIFVSTYDGEQVTFNDTASQAGFSCFKRTRYNDSASIANFTATNDCVGNFTFAINAWDTQSIAAKLVRFYVQNTNDLPYIVNTTPANLTTVQENGNKTFSIMIHDDDIRWGDRMTVRWYLDGVLSTGTGGKLNTTKVNESYYKATYYPRIDHSDAGMHSISVSIQDHYMTINGGDIEYSWDVQVINVNRPPIFTNPIQNFTWPEDTSLDGNISLMDHFHDDDNVYNETRGCWEDDYTGLCLGYSYIIHEGNVTQWTIEIGSDGAVNVTPKPDYFGTLMLQFSVFDGYASNYSNNVTFNVTNVPDAPRIDPFPDKTIYSWVYHTWQVSAYDPDGDEINFTISSEPAIPNMTIDSYGVIRVMADQSQLGEYNVTIIANDPWFNSTPEIFNLIVLNNSRPMIMPFPGDYFSVEQDLGGLMTLTGFDLDAEALYIWINHTINSTDNMTPNSSIFIRKEIFINPNITNYTMYNWTARAVNQSIVGIHRIRAWINDSRNARNAYDFTFEIIDTPHPPIMHPVVVRSNQLKFNMSFNKTVYSLDVDGDFLEFTHNSSLFTFTNLNRGSYFENASARMKFTPVTLGWNHINITAIDEQGRMNSTIFSYNVTYNRPPYFNMERTISCPEFTPCQIQIRAEDPDWQDRFNLRYGFSIINSTTIVEKNLSNGTLVNVTLPSEKNFYMDELGHTNFIPRILESYNVSIWVTDGIENISEIFMINVTDVDTPPFFIPLNITDMPGWYTMEENKMSDFYIEAYDLENQTISIEVKVMRFINLNHSVWTDHLEIPFNSKLQPISKDVRWGTINDSLNNATTNISAWRLRFRPAWHEVGNYTVNVSISDNLSVRHQQVNFSILNLNDRPIINWSLFYPNTGLMVNRSNESYFEINCTENTTMHIFSHAFDYDYDPLTYRWYAQYVGGYIEEVSTDPSIEYVVPFRAYPIQNLTLVVSDPYGASATMRWVLFAENVNRNITFGIKQYEWNLTNDVFRNTTISDGHLKVLEEMPGSYYTIASYRSPVIDFQTYSHDLPRIVYDTLEYSNAHHLQRRRNPVGWLINSSEDNSSDDSGNFSVLENYGGLDYYRPAYIVDFYTATSRVRSNPLHMWMPVGYNRSILSQPYQFFTFKAEIYMFENNETPEIFNISMRYRIADLRVPSESTYTAWIDLNHFFYDPDIDDRITYKVEMLESPDIMNVTILAGSIVSLHFISEGTAKFRFIGTDPYNTSIASNIITVLIESNDEDEAPMPSSSGGGGGGGVQVRKEYVYRDRDVPLAFDIIHPEKITIYGNQTIEIPVKLVNNEDFDLSKVIVTAFSDRADANITISTDYFEIIAAGETQEIMVTLTPSTLYESYDIYIDVNITDPKYHDSAKIMLTSLTRLGTSNESQQMKLAFVRDLLSKNKECAELSEYITRAREFINQGQYDLADHLLEQFIEDCKLLMREEPKNLEMPLGWKSYMNSIMESRENLFIAITIGSVLLLVIIFAVVMAYRKI